MQIPSIELDVLFKRTRTALDTANGSPLKDGLKADGKVQDILITQYGEGARSWHEFVKSIKSRNESASNTTTDDWSDTFLKFNDDKNLKLMGEYLGLNDPERLSFFKSLKPLKKEHLILIEKALKDDEVVAPIGKASLTIDVEALTMHKWNKPVKEVLIHRDGIDITSNDKVYTIPKETCIGNIIKDYQLKLGMADISIQHGQTLLNSCEKALEEAHDKILVSNDWRKTNLAIPMIVQAMFDFIFEYQSKIKNSIENGGGFFDDLTEELNDYFLNHHEIVYEKDEYLKNLITGFAEQRLKIDLNYIHEMEFGKIGYKTFSDMQNKVHGAAYVELTKDSLYNLSQLIRTNNENKEWTFENLKSFINNNIKNIF